MVCTVVSYGAPCVEPQGVYLCVHNIGRRVGLYTFASKFYARARDRGLGLTFETLVETLVLTLKLRKC